MAANLQARGNDLPHYSLLRGVLRHSWAKNQKLFAAVLPALRHLKEEGIPFLFLKGAALNEIYRQFGGTRPMDDVDILVRPHDFARAAKAIGFEGFRPRENLTTERLSDLLRFRHELTLSRDDGVTLDVHWYLVSDAYDTAADDRFWGEAVPYSLGSFAGRALNASDQFVHTCLHGVQWNEVSPVRWLADAHLLIRGGIDWKRVEIQARLLGRLRPVRDTILYLHDLGTDLPESTVLHWRNISLTPIEEVEGDFRAVQPNVSERTKQLAWVYLRLSRQWALREVLATLPDFMRQIHHFRSYSRRFKFLFYLSFLLLRGRRKRM